MKSISASIIVLAAAILILGGHVVLHGDTSTFVMALGCAVGVIGLWGWFISLRE
jgi:hypothetical protein